MSYSDSDADAKVEIERSQQIQRYFDDMSRGERIFTSKMRQLCEVLGETTVTTDLVDGKNVITTNVQYLPPNAIGGDPMKEDYRINQKADLIRNNNQRRLDSIPNNPLTIEGDGTEPIETPEESEETPEE